ncbi:MAG TPA: ATP-binding protein [Chitinophagaceae bacterium]
MTIFLILINVLLLIFISGILYFVFQYRKRKQLHEKEKSTIEKQHQFDLLNAQFESQQQTMQHIGEEIHDSVAQKLTLASIYAQRMEFESKSPETTQKLAGISKIINDSLLELRQLSSNLTDSKIQYAGLAELIMMECEQVKALGICEAKLDVNTLPELNISTKISLIRIIQEFIQNSVKHSGCSTITIRAIASGNKIQLILSDNGRGFDTETAGHNGNGLNNIRRRIQMLNGTYNFTSKFREGTSLDIVVPFTKTNA